MHYLIREVRELNTKYEFYCGSSSSTWAYLSLCVCLCVSTFKCLHSIQIASIFLTAKEQFNKG